MEKEIKEIYEKPETKKTQVKMEGNICAASNHYDKEIINNDTPSTVDIDAHTNGGEYNVENWD